MDSSIKFNVSANTAQFEAGMRRVGSVAQTTGDRIRSAFSGLGGLLAGGAIVAGLQSVLRKMDDISDRAKRFQVSAEEIQRVGNAAEIVGTNFDSVARAINRTGVAANKAAREGGSVAEAFARVNLDPAAFAAASLEERIQMIGKAQQAANGDAQKMSDLFEVIGVKAANINFTDLLAEMKQVNAASNDTVETLAEANDRLEKATQLATVFGANLINGISKAAERFGSFLGGAGFKTVEELDKENARKNAEARLRQQGKLLPDDTVVRRGMVNTPAGTVPGGLEAIAGPNAKENQRRIDAEMARLEAERKSAENASRKIRVDDADEPIAQVKDASGRVAQVLREIESVYRREIDAINASPISQAGQANKRKILDTQYNEAKQKAFDYMARQAATPEALRQAPQDPNRAAAIEAAQSDRATETTLQKVAKFLEELNTKLPQPVLV